MKKRIPLATRDENIEDEAIEEFTKLSLRDKSNYLTIWFLNLSGKVKFSSKLEKIQYDTEDAPALNLYELERGVDEKFPPPIMEDNSEKISIQPSQSDEIFSINDLLDEEIRMTDTKKMSFFDIRNELKRRGKLVEGTKAELREILEKELIGEGNEPSPSRDILNFHEPRWLSSIDYDTPLKLNLIESTSQKTRFPTYKRRK